ncbi:MAG: phosphotransferase family protein [Chloroflexota bacterium]
MIETNKAEDFRQRLAEYLEAVTQKDDVDIEALQPLAGGASRDSWLVKAKVGSDIQQFVLRRDLATTMYDKALARDQEFLVMKAVCESGVLAPRPRWYCLEPAILDQPFFIMDFVDGISIGTQVVNQPELAVARTALPGQMGEQLAKIHALDTTQNKLGFLPHPRVGFSPAQEAIAQIRGMILKLAVHNPVFEFGLRWLQQNAPKTDKPVFLHGDFRVGNFLVGEKGLNGIIDWEFARIGDPLEDLAWPCLRDWRYGNGQLRLGGIGQREPFIQAYERGSGRAIDRKAVDYWEILGNLRWAVTCLSQANRHLSGGDPSVELASLGRRSSEMQFEMLQLIEAQGLKDHV